MLHRFAVTVAALAVFRIAVADEVPANLGLGLRGLVQTYTSDPSNLRAKLDIARSRGLQFDAKERATVNIHLDGTRTAGEVTLDLQALGVEILVVDTHWRNGVISAHLPLGLAVPAAHLRGVRSVMLAPRPIHHAGSVTAQSSVVDRAAQVNQRGLFSTNGILGKGISVGVISDSYDAASGVPRAAAGVASGDLPGAGNPDGYTQAVVVIDDNFAPGGGQTDEGRAMAEIVHDIAPAAKIAFSTVQETQSIMAFSIRNLRANEDASCDIIVDDVFFADEPFFSDGQLALAVEDVVNGSALPGKKVAYFSAAGNEANYGYVSDLRLITAAQGVTAPVPAPTPGATPPALHWEQVPASLYAGGFHNINPSGTPAVAMPIQTQGSPFLDLQWDDPFDADGVTTDYNLLLFDADGNYEGFYSGTDNNISTDEPVEFALLDTDATNYVVISLASTSAPVAEHLRFVAPNGGGISGPYISYEASSMVGHATARSANAVGAYVYNTTPRRDPNYNPAHSNPPPGPYKPGREDFTSNGGALPFYFDADGRRLAAPEIRVKPEFSAAEGVDTTFFGSDYDHDNFLNFFGTSAAAPTAAAVGALMLEAAGGPGKLSAAAMRTKLQQTAIPHDLDPFFSQARASRETASLTVSAHGDSSDASADDPNFFAVTFAGNPGETLTHLEIDLSNVGLVFDETTETGYPFTVGSNPNGVVVVAHTVSSNRRVLSLDFTNFKAGDSLSFGIDRDLEISNAEGNLADLLAGADIRATHDGAVPLQGAFVNEIGSGYTLADGFGLVDARAAVETIVRQRVSPSGLPVNVSTRAFSGTNDEVLIGGFITQGGNKEIIVRAIGPSLLTARTPIPGAMIDPTLTLYDANGSSIAGNNNWQDDPTQAGEIQRTGLAPSDPRESAIVETLASGAYTAIVRGNGGTTGVALVEVYDVDAQPASARLANLSSRGLVLTGDSVLIGGFIVRGNDPANVVVRALGPSLSSSAVAGTLQDPKLELYDGEGNLMATNDNWQQDSDQATQITAAGLAPANGLESAVAATLQPGNYTAVVRGVADSTGIGLIEMYHVR